MVGIGGDRTSARTRASAVMLGAALVLAGCSSGGGTGEPGTGNARQPASEGRFWVNPDGSAARQVAAYEKAGKSAEAAQIRKIAGQPTGQWIGVENAESEARGITEAAAASGRTALLVLYNIPHRDCGQYSRGGVAGGSAYRAWIDAVARGIGDRRTLVVLEPDAVLHAVDECITAPLRGERYDLLEDAVTKLKSLKGTEVYLDAGNPGWGRPEQLREPLQRAGIGRADGFSVNVSNFFSTEDSIAYGKQLSAEVGNKHFVIDTSRNGNGPYTEGDPAQRWCNPPGRALGEVPTTKTADPLVDAYLWVKRPGESDGTCKGGPPAGRWWAGYALALARNTR
ncbi:glycoside hydrolase family 6 protein [Streptomyces actinomycinicus]|uniref:Glucanase n=1 Tax=Streptomyces actinomycinicus TaxID=1695166 RepID=A0A937EKL0_9ACTN|nr:glycoside hydrolase family 6 protein [Streptomyces actinomycinicus]MBL1083780.1 glycoside hydrolase family 6 protein [Streptomyces actinomycinicus]